MLRIIATTALAFSLLSLGSAQAGDRPILEIVWPTAGSVIELGDDSEKAIGVVVRSNYKLLPAGECGDVSQCGHLHMKIDPAGDSCNIPGKPYNSMNSDFGGDLIKARFGHCPDAASKHVIGVLLADDYHQPILVDGKPVTAVVTVTTK
ncbi:hypothetical protein [Mesorhizobium sp.]|uniref:hypothetical protein n=1 Tax=Mesorhizobium sp. TaxID=1871066 RepID=UPI001207FF5E|nr:hypothetical protein [Mesorhizobium sp.]TIS87350.1 MAG: hypothetical protein E5W89_25005 [Mesorhizobium sp.]